MRTERITSQALKLSVMIGFVLILIGEAVDLCDGGDSLLRFGLLFLIVSPLVAIVATMVSFAVDKEWKWVISAIIVIFITIIGILMAVN